MSVIVVGDTHFRYNEPYYSAGVDFADWLVNHPENASGNTLIHVGDLAHRAIISGRVGSLAVDLFLNRLQFDRIIFVAGNHDYDRASHSLSLDTIRPIPCVEVYSGPTTITLEGKSYLLLPYYYPSVVDLPSMKEHYESMEDQQTDYIIGHIADETQTLFGNYIDISHMSGRRILGHVHRNSGNYIGPPFLLRYDERGQDCRLLKIDGDTVTDISVPKLLDFYEVEYPNSLYDTDARYPYWTVTEAPSEDVAYEHYTDAYVRAVHKTRQSKTDQSGSTQSDNGSMGMQEYLEELLNNENITSETTKRILREKVKEKASS